MLLMLLTASNGPAVDRSHTWDLVALMASMEVAEGCRSPHWKSRSIRGIPQILMMMDLVETLKDTKGNGFKDLTL